MRLLLIMSLTTLSLNTWGQAPAKPAADLPSKTTTTIAPAEAPVVTTPARDPKTGAPILNFNTLGQPNTKNERGGLQFKVPLTETEKADLKSADPVKALPPDEPFKTFIGYPKNQIGLFYRPANINAIWQYGDSTFNFTSTATQAFGLNYRFIATPQFQAELDWSSYAFSVPEGTANTFSVLKSDVTIQSIFVRADYSWVGTHSFFHRYGLGFDLGNDAYPILDFAGSGGTLQVSQVKDIVVGLTAHFQYPLIQSVVLKTKAGYNLGTGGGNSGDLTSKKNNSYFAQGRIVYMINDLSSIEAGADFRVRTATVSGKRGNLTDEWITKATNVTFDLGYVHTF